MQIQQDFAIWLSKRRLLPYRIRRSIIKRIWPKMLQSYDFTCPMVGKLQFHGNIRNYIDRIIYFCGAHETYMLYFLRDAIPALKKTRKDKLSFLDVGANAGNHSLYMATLVSNVFAFEPFERVRKQLEHNITLNQLTNIRVFDVGLGDENTELPFFSGPEENLGSASFAAGHRPENTPLATLKLRVGDGVITEEQLGRIDIIKADVEGFEPQVIRGLSETIKRDRPLIIVECSATTKQQWSNKQAILHALPEQYHLFAFAKGSNDTGRYQLAPYDDQADYKIEDVICIPKELLQPLGLNQYV